MRSPVPATREVQRIVAQALAAFERRTAVLVPGRLQNRLQALATRLMPRAALIRIAETSSRKMMMAGRV